LALLHWFLHLNVKQDGLSASRHVTDRVTCSTLTDRSLPEQQSPLPIQVKRAEIPSAVPANARLLQHFKGILCNYY